MGTERTAANAARLRWILALVALFSFVAPQIECVPHFHIYTATAPAPCGDHQAPHDSLCDVTSAIRTDTSGAGHFEPAAIAPSHLYRGCPGHRMVTSRLPADDRRLLMCSWLT